MRIFIIIFILPISVRVLAQSDIQKDTATYLYVIDNKVSADGIKSVDAIPPGQIIDSRSLTAEEAKAKYGAKGEHGAIIVTTEPFAIWSYQEKLSTLSDQYKDYLHRHKNNDKDILYTINGLLVDQRSDKDKMKLFAIAPGNIDKAEFAENSFYNGSNSKRYMLLITTKK